MNTYPPQFYLTLEPEMDSLSAEENASRKRFNIEQLDKFRIATIAETLKQFHWQTIDTAPHDTETAILAGRLRFLDLGERGIQPVVEWASSMKWEENENHKDGGFFYESGCDPEENAHAAKPTHWMKLPALMLPPEKKDAAKV